MSVTAPAAVACVLLVAAGVAKALRPQETALALRVSGLRTPDAAVRIGGAAEAAIGAAALVTGQGLPMFGAALSYLAFTGFVVIALARRWPLSTCGCFGQPDTPPTFVHVVVVGAAAFVCGSAYLTSAPPLTTVIAGERIAGLGLAALVVLTAVLGSLALGSLARLRAVGRTMR